MRLLSNWIDMLWIHNQMLFATLVPVLALAAVRPPSTTPLLVYAVTSFALACYAVRGLGVERNAWFDLFVASAAAFGCLVTAASAHRVRAFAVVIVLVSVPFVTQWKVPLALIFVHGDYRTLVTRELAFENDVALMRSVDGPALFEEPLLGIEAGKDFVVDAFNTSIMIRSGRVPESLLIQPILQHRFCVVALQTELQKALSIVGQHRDEDIFYSRWTYNTLKALNENYEPLNDGKSHEAYFYAPRAHITASAQPGQNVCRRQRLSASVRIAPNRIDLL